MASAFSLTTLYWQIRNLLESLQARPLSWNSKWWKTQRMTATIIRSRSSTVSSKTTLRPSTAKVLLSLTLRNSYQTIIIWLLSRNSSVTMATVSINSFFMCICNRKCRRPDEIHEGSIRDSHFLCMRVQRESRGFSTSLLHWERPSERVQSSWFKIYQQSDFRGIILAL